MKISEVMQKEIVSANIEMSVGKVGQLFVSKKIGCAPVLSADGELMGIVSKSDLIESLAERTDQGLMTFSDPTIKIWEIMSSKLLKVEADEDVESVARKMRDAHVHRVLVYDGGELVGLATAFDMLEALADRASEPE
jgi:predicted transcriptional regulator